MVQKSRTKVIVLGVLLRIVLLCIVSVLAFYTTPFGLDVLRNYLGYQTPMVTWGDILVDGVVAFALTLIFWSAIIFVALGKKIDYIFIFLSLILGFLDFYTTETTTVEMYIGLIGVAVIASLIGFALKLLRQKFLPNIKI